MHLVWATLMCKAIPQTMLGALTDRFQRQQIDQLLFARMLKAVKVLITATLTTK